MEAPLLKAQDFFIVMSNKKFVKLDLKLARLKRISWFDKILLSEIIHLHLLGECTASNEYFAKLFNVDKTFVSRRISHLRKMELLKPKKLSKGCLVPCDKNDETSLQEMINRHFQNDETSLINDETSFTLHINSNNRELEESGEENTPASPEPEKPNLQDDDVKDAIKDINRQKFGPTIEEELYAIMAAATDTHFGPMTTEQRKTMKKLFYQIRDYLQDYKKRVEKNPYYNASSQEIKEHFKDFCNDLPDFVKQQRYTPAYLNMKYGDLLIEIQQKKEKAKPEKVKPKIYQMKKRKR